MIPGDVRDGATLNETFEPCDHGGLQEQWDPTFSEHSFGFRPGRSAHQAVAQAQRYVADGYNVVVDLDLERFFDRVNHDILMSRVAARIASRYTGPPPRPLYGSLTLTDKSSHGWGSEHARLPAARRGC